MKSDIDKVFWDLFRRPKNGNKSYPIPSKIVYMLIVFIPFMTICFTVVLFAILELSFNTTMATFLVLLLIYESFGITALFRTSKQRALKAGAFDKKWFLEINNETIVQYDDKAEYKQTFHKDKVLFTARSKNYLYLALEGDYRMYYPAKCFSEKQVGTFLEFKK